MILSLYYRINYSDNFEFLNLNLICIFELFCMSHDIIILHLGLFVICEKKHILMK